MMKNALQTIIVSAIATVTVWNMAAAPVANAEFYNFGTLDVKPIHADEGSNQDWFVEYLAPGQQKQEAIQISNFSPEPKELSIYVADTATNEGKTFQTKNLHENSDDVSDWIHLPIQKITLQSGESRILSTNFIIPKNAGVGLHTGAIIVRENGSEFSIEKGVRIYMNITGPVIENGSIQSVSSTQTGNLYKVNVQTANTGTVDYKTDYTVQLQDIFGTTHQTVSATSRTEPQTTHQTTLSIQKPTFGFYNMVLSNGSDQTNIGTILFVPLWAIGAFMILVLIAIKPETFTVSSLQKVFQSSELKKGFAYFGLLAVVATSVAAQSSIDPTTVQAQITSGPPSVGRGSSNQDNTPSTPQNVTQKDKSATEYVLTIKWGEVRRVPVPGNKTKEWHGRLNFQNARVTTSELLHFERTDQAEVKSNKAELQFDLLTGPDNDGVILNVQAVGNQTPTVTYQNTDTGEEFELQITDLVGSSSTFAQGLWGVQFEADYTEQEKARRNVISLTQTTEGEATPDTLEEGEATPQRFAQIPELENLFVEELPATREQLTDFILKSDYVEEVVNEDSTQKLRTDSILLQALKATPEVLEELTATPDLNFVFVPTEEISFPPQEFSFNENKESEQNLGTLIFVQNTNTPWNTFVGTTDFQLLSGDHIIPASSLTVIPGEVTVLTEDGEEDINPGEEKKLTGRGDRTTLINANATRGQKKAFVLNPRLRVQIPSGTPAGTYRGELTITSL
ncbi:MAG: DUF916 domain-containing protein [Candidatus Gracilibacteria bacterium]